MGWLEVLALLKRLGPTLTRLVPMLEMFVASRGGSRGDTEATNSLHTEIKDELAAAARNHAALVESFAGHASQMAVLRDDLRSMREADESAAARLLALEVQVAALAKFAGQAKHLLTAVLGVCILLLVAVALLLVRR